MADVQIGDYFFIYGSSVNIDIIVRDVNGSLALAFMRYRNKSTLKNEVMDTEIIPCKKLEGKSKKHFNSVAEALDYALGVSPFSKIQVVEKYKEDGSVVCGIKYETNNMTLVNFFDKKGFYLVARTHIYNELSTFKGNLKSACEKFKAINNNGENCLNSI